MTEVNFPLIMEDFEVGDRVSVAYTNGVIDLGAVRDIRTDIRMNVLLDHGKVAFVHINQFGPKGQYRRCFPMEQLQVGSLVSICAGSGERFYADVTTYFPNKYVELKYHEVNNRIIIEAEDGKPLEFLLAAYTLEG